MDILSELEYIIGEVDNSDISHYCDLTDISRYVLNKAQKLLNDDKSDKLDLEIQFEHLFDLVNSQFDKLQEPDEDDEDDKWDIYDKRLEKVKSLDNALSDISRQFYDKLDKSRTK